MKSSAVSGRSSGRWEKSWPRESCLVDAESLQQLGHLVRSMRALPDQRVEVRLRDAQIARNFVDQVRVEGSRFGAVAQVEDLRAVAGLDLGFTARAGGGQEKDAGGQKTEDGGWAARHGGIKVAIAGRARGGRNISVSKA